MSKEVENEDDDYKDEDDWGSTLYGAKQGAVSRQRLNFNEQILSQSTEQVIKYGDPRAIDFQRYLEERGYSSSKLKWR